MATGGDTASVSTGVSRDKNQPSSSSRERSLSCPSKAAPLTEFPHTQAYALRFVYNTSEGVEEEVVRDDFVVLLDSDEQLKNLHSLKESLNTTDSVQLDRDERQIVLRHRQPVTAPAQPWIDSLQKKIRSEVRCAEHAVVFTGPSADQWKERVDKKLSSTNLSCTPSSDNQSLLLLSSNRGDVVSAQRFIERVTQGSGSLSEYVSSSQVQLSVRRADITTLDVDGIVSPVDERLRHRRGVSRAIASAAGRDLENEVNQHVQRYGQAKVTAVVVTTAGNLGCKSVLHAVGPRWSDYADKDQCKRDLTDTVLNCLQTASRLGLSTLALPALSSGYRGVKLEVCVSSYQTALETFQQNLRNTSLREIVFVDTREEVVLAFNKALKENSPVFELQDNLRVLVVGKTGMGKSSLGNSILRTSDAFHVCCGFKASTEISSLAFAQVGRLLIEVVDTPGLCPPGGPREEEQIKKEIVKSLTYLLPGPHVILIVFRADVRFANDEAKLYEEVQNLLSGDSEPEILPSGDSEPAMDLFRFVIPVFTHIDSECELAVRLKDVPDCLSELLRRCDGRYAAINTHAACQAKEQQVDQLINKILEVRTANEGKEYTNGVIDRCRQIVMSDKYADKTFDQIKRDVQSGDETVVSTLLADPETQSFIRRLWKKCTIL